MLIAVSIKEPDLNSELSDAFGRSKHFLLFNSDTKDYAFAPNPYSLELGGAGIQTARFLIERKVEAVITVFMGFNTLRFFNSLNVKIYSSENCRADESLKLLMNDELKLINQELIVDFPKRKRQRNRKKFSIKTTLGNLKKN